MTTPQSPLTEEFRLMFRPRATYRAGRHVAVVRAPWWLVLRRPLLMLGAIAAFVSFTSAGRLVALQMLLTMVAWGFLPLFQLGVIAAVVTLFVRNTGLPRSRMIDLYFVGHGPWYLFLLIIVGICLLAPSVYEAISGLLRVGVLPALLLLTLGWGVALTYAFFRHACGVSRGRASLLSAGTTLTNFALILGYYLVTYQLQPLLR